MFTTLSIASRRCWHRTFHRTFAQFMVETRDEMLILSSCVVLLLVTLCESSNSTSTRQRRHASSDSCGVPNVSGAGLIYNGENFPKDAWPWMVALMMRQEPVPKFICGGTLISQKQVLTGENVNVSRDYKLIKFYLRLKRLTACIRST